MPSVYGRTDSTEAVIVYVLNTSKVYNHAQSILSFTHNNHVHISTILQDLVLIFLPMRVKLLTVSPATSISENLRSIIGKNNSGEILML